MRRALLTLGLLGAVSLLASAPAQASLIIYSGNVPQGDENILMVGGSSGNPVLGFGNDSGFPVQFSSTLDAILNEPSSGAARIESADGVVNEISVEIPGGTYTSLIFNAFVNRAPGGPVSISVVANDLTLTGAFSLSNGSNFFTIVALGGETILNTTVAAGGGFDDLRQIRVGGPTVPVPEPATLTLFAAGIAGILARSRRRHR